MDKVAASDTEQGHDQLTDRELVELSAVEREQVAGGLCDSGWIIIEK